MKISLLASMITSPVRTHLATPLLSHSSRTDDRVTYPSMKASAVLEVTSESPLGYVGTKTGRNTTHACSLLTYPSVFDGLRISGSPCYPGSPYVPSRLSNLARIPGISCPADPRVLNFLCNGPMHTVAVVSAKPYPCKTGRRQINDKKKRRIHVKLLAALLLCRRVSRANHDFPNAREIVILCSGVLGNQMIVNN